MAFMYTVTLDTYLSFGGPLGLGVLSMTTTDNDSELLFEWLRGADTSLASPCVFSSLTLTLQVRLQPPHQRHQ